MAVICPSKGRRFESYPVSFAFTQIADKGVRAMNTWQILIAEFTKYLMKGGLSMKRRTIDTMREVRLWVGQIVVPAITLAATSMAIPEVRQAVAAKASQWKRSIENKVKKNEES